MAVTVRGTAVPTGNPTTTGTVVVPAGTASGEPLGVWITSRDSVGAGTLTVTDNDTGGNTWTKLTNSTDHRASFWGKRATSGTAGKTVTVSNAVGSLSFALVVFTGAIASGDWWANLAVETNASTDETHAGITPAVADAFVWLSVHNYANDNAVTTPATATNPGALNTLSIEKLSTGGSDCGCHVAGKAQVGAAAATGNFTWAQVDGTTYSIVGIIKPVVTTYIDAVAAGTATVSGTGVGDVLMNGVAAGAVSVAGAAVGEVVVPAIGVGGVAVSGSAVGEVVVPALASGAVTVSGVGVGEIITPYVDAVADGSVTVTGAAVGQVVVPASGPGIVTVTGTAVGEVVIPALAAGSLTIGGSAVGVVVTDAVAAGAVTVGGVGAAEVVINAVAAGLVTITGTGVGEIPGLYIDGVASGSLTVVGVGVGVVVSSYSPPLIINTGITSVPSSTGATSIVTTHIGSTGTGGSNEGSGSLI